MESNIMNENVTKKPKKPINYVDNTKFLELLEKYIQDKKFNEENGLEPPQIPNEIGYYIIQIANHLATRYNFANYTYVDEMIDAGILNAFEAIKSFNPEKSKNPFAYFTQVIYWAFVRVIKIENAEHKAKMALMFDGEDTFDLQDGDEYQVNKDALFLFYND